MNSLKASLFPNLQGLNTTCFPELNSLVRRLGVSINQVYLSLPLGRPESSTLDGIRQLPQTFPRLTSLESHQVHSFPLLFKVLPLFTHLEVVNLGKPSIDQLLLPLSSLPNLRRLRCVLRNGLPRRELGEQGFVALEEIYILIGDSLDVTYLFQFYITSSRLHTIRIMVDNKDADLNQLTMTITARYSSTLRSFWLRWAAYFDANTAITVLDLKPLYLCRHLEIFILEGPQAVMRFDDRDVEAMTRAWPRLKTLKLRDSTETAPPTVTLRALQTLARLCFRLDILEVSVDASTGIPQGPAPTTRMSWLRRLNLSSSVPCGEDVRGVAKFIRETFPRLDRFEASESYWSKSSTLRADTWPEVKRHVLTPE